MANAGNFNIFISSPYPAWAEVSYKGERLCSIHHNELSDLKYTVDKAMKEARELLPEADRGEV